MMNIRCAERLNAFQTGIFTELDQKKEQLLKAGKKVYNLSVGTPDFEPDSHVMHALTEAAKKPENYKYSLRDKEELTDAVIRYYKTRFGVKLDAGETMALYGSQEGIAHIGLALCDPGDLVLVPNPGYPIFEIGPYLAGAEIGFYELKPENQYLPDLKAISKETAKRAKMMIVSYPLNPVCAVAPDSFYEELITWAEENEVILVHDSAYADIVYDGKICCSFLSYEGAKEVGVELYSLSKSFNMTGCRVSFVSGNREIIQNFKKLRSQIDYGLFLPIQEAAIAALTGPQERVKEHCREYERRRNVLCEGLQKAGFEAPLSAGTMFAWMKVPDGYTSTAFCMELMEKTGVLCTPGNAFGSLGEGYVRFALVLPAETIREAVSLIQEKFSVTTRILQHPRPEDERHG